MKNSEFGIGQLSKRTGCNIETVRYYEREGLLPKAPRAENGYRIYDEDQLKRLTFICRARNLGFTLQEVRGLLEMVDRQHDQRPRLISRSFLKVVSGSGL